MWEQVLSKLLYLKAQSCEITFKKPRSVAVEIWQWVICIGTSCSTGLLLATIFWKPDLWRLQQTDRFLQCLSNCLLVLSDASRVDSSFIAFVKFQSVAPCSLEVFQGFEPILECSGTASLKVVNSKYCSVSDARMGAAVFVPFISGWSQRQLGIIYIPLSDECQYHPIPWLPNKLLSLLSLQDS